MGRAHWVSVGLCLTFYIRPVGGGGLRRLIRWNAVTGWDSGVLMDPDSVNARDLG